MDKVKSCIDRINVIRGVNYGKITLNHIQDLFTLLELNEDEQKAVFEHLKDIHLQPLEEDETIKIDKNVHTKEDLCKNEKYNFKNLLESCTHKMSENPSLKAQYIEEIGVIKKRIASGEIDMSKNPYRCIIKSLMFISDYRVREYRDDGWACGTQESLSRQRFNKWMRCVFSESELRELLNNCVNDIELNERQNNIFFVLLHHTPTALMHRYIFDE